MRSVDIEASDDKRTTRQSGGRCEQLDDEDLYRRMKMGSQDAFACLYERRAPGLYRFALHMTGSPAIAEEVSQEVFIQLMGAASRFDPARGSLESFLFGIARNLIRSVRRQGPVAEPVDQPFDPGILNTLIGNETSANLHRTIRDLPERYRDVIIFCELEERSYEDVARILGCPVGTVRSRLHRARALVSAKLKRMQTASEVLSA